jgi:hypothetical protein
MKQNSKNTNLYTSACNVIQHSSLHSTYRPPKKRERESSYLRQTPWQLQLQCIPFQVSTSSRLINQIIPRQITSTFKILQTIGLGLRNVSLEGKEGSYRMWNVYYKYLWHGKYSLNATANNFRLWRIALLQQPMSSVYGTEYCKPFFFLFFEEILLYR